MPKFTETGLETLTSNCQNWTEIMKRNAIILNDALLLVGGMLDVNITSLTNRDILVWNAASSKFVNQPYETIIGTTTTTSSSSTTSTTN